MEIYIYKKTIYKLQSASKQNLGTVRQTQTDISNSLLIEKNNRITDCKWNLK